MSSCVNRGGTDSLLRLTAVPFLEHKTEIDPAFLPALEIWRARPGEAFTAQGDGILQVNLGPRILRTETAAIVDAAILQSRIGDFR